MNRYWILFYKFSCVGQQGNGYIQMITKNQHISFSVATKEIEKQLTDEHKLSGVKVSITSFNELSEEDYEWSK